MIKLTNLSKVYRTAYMETVALNSINLHIGKGEFVAVMGPSGCGKSTLLNVVGMIDNPSSGEYYFDGEEIGSRSENDLVDLRKSNIGFIFQNFNLIDDLSVRENVDLPLHPCLSSPISAVIRWAKPSGTSPFTPPMRM